jgi:HEAT repeat protein
VRLAPGIVQAGNEFWEAFMAAVQRGDAGEDDSQGHALSRDPATRKVQERFVMYATRDLKELRRVLRNSSDADQRALAAQILGYAANKHAVVSDLVYAMRDPSPDVRNNAMRALAVFASMAPSSERPVVRVPYEPFIELLGSPEWTDRNKASFALLKLSVRRDPKLLEELKHEAMGPLIEMANWKSQGHAMPALLILGRIGGLSDDDIQAASARGQRQVIINAAFERH